MLNINCFLEALRPLHDHICPRQILGARIGMYAASLLEIPMPQVDKRIFCFVETDGCFVDGIIVTTGCSIGHRTMRLVDYGKVAATFVDTMNQHAVRIWPQPSARERARHYAPDATDSWHAQFTGYQIMPASELLCVQTVELSVSLQAIISKPGLRLLCNGCGEEIMNQREVMKDGEPLCIPCTGEGYYHVTG